MRDNVQHISDRKTSGQYSEWISHYQWNAFITIRFDAEEYCRGVPECLAVESADERIPLAQAARMIHKHVFYQLERLTHHQIAALGAVMPRTAQEPRHAHYCLLLQGLSTDSQEYEQKLAGFNQALAVLCNSVCTSARSVLLTPYTHHSHPYYLALGKNMTRADAIPDTFRPGNFIPLLKEAA